eukprot:4413093-Ditylum_brightwellii.AAC.1
MGKDRLLGPSAQMMPQALPVPVMSRAPQGPMVSALAASSKPVMSPNANGDQHLRKEGNMGIYVGNTGGSEKCILPEIRLITLSGTLLIPDPSGYLHA